MTVHECHCGFDEIDHTVTLDESVQHAIESQVNQQVQWATSTYQNHFAVLTIHFAEGSSPAAVSIPYQPFHNRADIHLPFRVVKEETCARCHVSQMDHGRQGHPFQLTTEDLDA